MGFKPTQQQLQAIHAPHNHNAIVTAAAGSGKTTLLVSRIIRLLSDPSTGVTADSLAIMTFTKNAAAQLRVKLTKKLSERIKELIPEETQEAADTRKYLSEQMIALRSASIGTIDSFCLNIIRENVQAFSLPMSFTVADKARIFSMQQQSMKRTLAYFYDKNEGDKCSPEDISPEERRILFCTFSFEDDEALQESVLSVFNTISNYEDRDKWLEGCIETYSDFGAMFKKYSDSVLKELENAIHDSCFSVMRMEELVLQYATEQDARKTWSEEVKDSLSEYARKCSEYYNAAVIALDKLKQDFTPQTLDSFFKNLPQLSLPTISAKDRSAETKKAFTKAKNEFKLAETLAGLTFDAAEEERVFAQQKIAVGAFVKLLRCYSDSYRSIMQTNGTIDFAECEYLLLEKLRSDETLRNALSERFSCIIVDEFQDSNDMQAEIFRLISNGKHNLFFVGDVKQSIYAFRGGNPKIMERLSRNPNKLARLYRNRYGRLEVLQPEKVDFWQEYRSFRAKIKLNGGKLPKSAESLGRFTVIPLNKNFRSRKSVVDSVNAIFSGLMTLKYGGVDYANGAQLALGSDGFYMPIPKEREEEYATEIHLLTYAGTSRDSGSEGTDSSDEEISSAMKQARFVAQRIEQLISSGFLVTDGAELRPCRYGDIAVLMRKNDKLGIYKEALAERSIPSLLPKDAGFLCADEVALTLDLLRVIDDPLKDECMLRVLMSPLYGFTADEIAQIRLGVLGFPLDTKIDLSPIAKLVRKRSLYGCISFCSRETQADIDESEAQLTLDELEKANIKRVVSKKVTAFLEQLENFRFIMSNSSVSDLILRVCDDTDMLSIISTYEASRQRLANIRLLGKYAEDFESADGGSLSDFLRFIDRLGENSLEAANAPEDSADAVRFMTFHASKGLEMPICILAGMDSGINTKDARKPVLRHHDYGMALSYVNADERYEAKPLSYRALSKVISENMYSEELRLLYVAMTRPMDKLIITGGVGKKHKLSENFSANTSPAALLEGTKPLKWLVKSLLRYAVIGTAEAFDDNESADKEIDIKGIKIAQHSEEVVPEAKAKDTAKALPPEADEALTAEILHNLSLSYGDEAATVMQAKYSVTELAHKDEENSPNAMVYLHPPSFAKKGQPTGKEIGDAYHHFMEHVPLEEMGGDIEAKIIAIANTLADGAKITETEREILTSDKYRCAEKLARFFESELGKRMLADPSRVRRETPFYAEIPADKLGLTAADGSGYSGLISLQGRTDMFFYEGEGDDEGIVLVDYKSDTAANLEKELENYCTQLITYKEILPLITGVRVKQVYIFGFSEGVTIDVEEWLKAKGK